MAHQITNEVKQEFFNKLSQLTTDNVFFILTKTVIVKSARG